MNLYKIITSVLFFFTLLCAHAGEQPALYVVPSSPLQANDHLHHSSHQHTYTPLGVMGAHLHAQGEFMLSYRYMTHTMEDNYSGRRSLSTAEVLRDFMVAPDKMEMEMHMLGLMYAPTDWLTFMGMVNFVKMEMSHVRRTMMPGPDRFTTQSQGLGDSSVGAFFPLYRGDGHQLLGGLALALPTAEINKRGKIPNMAGTPVERVLPYPMQLGSGSWGLKPSLTYRGGGGSTGWGAQLSSTLYLSENEQDYQLGDRFEGTAWLSYALTPRLTTSLRLEGKQWGDIDGAHRALLPLPVPTARPDLRGGKEVNLYLGGSYDIGHFNFGVEVGRTLWVELDGPQLANQWSMTLGVKASW